MVLLIGQSNLIVWYQSEKMHTRNTLWLFVSHVLGIIKTKTPESATVPKRKIKNKKQINVSLSVILRI